MILERITELVQRAPELPTPLVRELLAELAQWPGDRALADAMSKHLDSDPDPDPDPDGM